MTMRALLVRALIPLALVPGVLAATETLAPGPVPPPAVRAIAQAPSGPPVGYYRSPALGKDVLVFVAEGDLWKVKPAGGVATRLTSHPGNELAPAISPDGQWLAFTAQYEGPTEAYAMPLSGGLPKRLTFDGANTGICGWTADGRVVVRSDKFSTLPAQQLSLIDPKTGTRTPVPLAQASDGAFDPAVSKAEDATLAFVRIPFNGSFTKRYTGGTIQQVWTYKPGEEAINRTSDYPGTSKRPVWHKGRIYFLTDRDGHMNVWSMAADGKDLKQHTRHTGFDIMDWSVSGDTAAYQLGADLYTLDLNTDRSTKIAITLDTDLDQLREKWIDKPTEFITSARLAPEGDKIVLTARGRVFVVPVKQGRVVDTGRDDGVRHRNARFLKDSDSVIALSDQTGEVEVWKYPANGVGEPEQLTKGSTVLKWGAIPNPEGTLIAHWNKDQELWIYDVEQKTDAKIETSTISDFSDLTWSPDGRWLAYVVSADNDFPTVRIWSAESKTSTTVTTDRYASYAPAWSRDGQWLFFLSDRTFRTLVPSPWGQNQPDPFLDETTKIYALALKPGQKWPFAPANELTAKDKKDTKDEDKPAKPDEPAKKDTAKADEAKNADAKPAEEKNDKSDKDKDAKDTKKPDAKKPKPVEITLEGLPGRLYEVPIKAGNYGGLTVNDKALFFTSRPTGFDTDTSLLALEIKNEQIETKTVASDIAYYELSENGKKILFRKKDSFYVVDAAPSPATELDKKQVSLAGWSLSLVPRVQWTQMFVESWRLMRDYFYDRNMHGVDWRAMLDKYRPLAERVTTRAELSDVISQMVGELSTLHHFVYGGDTREGPDKIALASLGAVLTRDEAAGGYRVVRIYQCEPDDPERVSPLAKPDVDVKLGDVITHIDGTPTLSVPHYAELLRQKAGKQVLLTIKPVSTPVPAPKPGTAADPATLPATFGEPRQAICVPITTGSENDLRYTDWQYTRRKLVDEWSGGKIGYVHLRAMGQEDYPSWVKHFYPVFNREGLILDVRNNRGGNIDSWILSKLMRKAWAFFTPRVGNPPSWNMQYAFRGHMVALCNERTSSDGETFSEGFRRLGLGKVIGTKTWGGGIWLSSSNVLVDRGIASASEFAVYGLDGRWMIEGTGVTPDEIVDNPPHATFLGEDAQLKAAVDHLLKQIAEKPIPARTPPTRPNKSSPDNAAKP